MLRLVLFATTAWAAYRIFQENVPPVPRGFDLPRGSQLGREPVQGPQPATADGDIPPN